MYIVKCVFTITTLTFYVTALYVIFLFKDETSKKLSKKVKNHNIEVHKNSLSEDRQEVANAINNADEMVAEISICNISKIQKELSDLGYVMHIIGHESPVSEVVIIIE